MPVSSLPSPYGFGTLGKAAYEFVDFLVKAKQTWWQILPVGQTSYGDSPYQSPSAYAGNPYMIDLDLLAGQGLLTKEEIESLPWGEDPEKADYGLLYENRWKILRTAAERGLDRDDGKVRAFTEQNSGWLPDYALFMALKKHFNMSCWLEWPEEIRKREPGALDHWRRELADDVRFYTYVQYLFFEQWTNLREYAHEKGIFIIGDIPLYMAIDSVDVWASPEEFMLDDQYRPSEVAGVPPDYFTADGQLWGNPIYNYRHMEETGFGWWIRRIDGAGKLYDVIRIDHFRGLESFWAVPAGEKTAKNGKWVKGPGMRLIQALKGWFPQVKFIAEDLGYPSPEVVQLLADSGFPGMKVLQFAFDSRDESGHLPHTYPRNCVCYAGTHDNETLLEWKDHAAKDDLEKAKAYLGLNDDEGFVWGILRGGMGSVADLFIAQMQDYLELGGEARMNRPGTDSGNWCWRMLPGAVTDELAGRIAAMTELFGRAPSEK